MFKFPEILARPRLVAALLFSMSAAACTGSGGIGDDNNGNNNANGDNNKAPTATYAPKNELGSHTEIVVTFSESMNPGSLALVGSLGDAATKKWSKDVEENDTLTLSPASHWSSGEQDLVVDAKDTDGAALASLKATFRVKAVFISFPPADVVIGQPDFGSGEAGTTSNHSLNAPRGKPGWAVEADTLFIPDTGANRVLGFIGLPQQNDSGADFALGQNSMSSNTANARGLNAPRTTTSYNGHLVVADTANNRVLIYKTIPNRGPGAPDVILGQPDFDTTSPVCSATGMNQPSSVAVTPDGALLVADTGNSRVLIWNKIPDSNAAAPDRLLGQGNYNACEGNDNDADGTYEPTWPPRSFTLKFPQDVWSNDEKVVVADTGNNRVLVWNSMPEEDFAAADRILGQRNFDIMAPNDDDGDGTTDDGGKATARVLNQPASVWSDGVQLYIADSGNNRILVWNEFPRYQDMAADIVIGQENFENNTANDANQDGKEDAAPSASTFKEPSGLRMIDGHLVVTDTGNSRILVFRSE